MKGEGGCVTNNNVDKMIGNFLLAYRSTPHRSVPGHRSPSEAFLGRRIRTPLDLLKPQQNSQGSRDDAMEQAFKKHHGAKLRSFKSKERKFTVRHSTGNV
jgi:hypothetical protein